MKSAVTLIAATTVHQAVRRKLVLMAAVACGGFLLLYGLAFAAAMANANNVINAASRLIQREAASSFMLLGLYAADLLTATIAILAASDTISGEIASGAMQTLASKPVARWQIFLGKWVGFVLLLTALLAVLQGGVMLIAWGFTGYSAPNVASGLGLLWLEMVVLVTITLLWGTRLSTLANGVLSLGLFGLAFLGGWIEQLGAVTQHVRVVQIGIVASLIMPSEARWRRAAFDMRSPLSAAVNFGPFTWASVPSGLMVVYAAAYAALALMLGLRSFATRDL